MSPTARESKDSPGRLLPHQAALLESFFDPVSKRILLLRSEVGLGKGAALVALVCRLLAEKPTARVLLLLPSALRSQMMKRLHDAGAPGMLVDRYRFRELLDSTTGTDLWPGGAVAVLSLDFAKQLDIRESLAESRWDLLIVDEAHSVRGARAEALRRVGASAGRIVLTTLPDMGLPDAFPAADTTEVEWRRDRLVDHQGTPLYAALRPLLHEVLFSCTAAELSLRETVGTLCKGLRGGTPEQVFSGMVLLRRLDSSLAALEGALQRLAARMMAENDVDQLPESSEDDVREGSPNSVVDGAGPEGIAALVERALEQIEAVAVDSKLSAFGALMNELCRPESAPRRIFAFSDSLATVYYLAAEIEGRETGCQVVQGGMSADDRQHALSLLLTEGAILVGTGAGMTEDLNIPEVTDLILYDIPGARVELQRLLGRFDRIGRLSQLDVHVLTPSDRPDGSSAEPLELLRSLLPWSTNTQP